MLRSFFVALMAVFVFGLAGNALANNTYPIIFVHGWMGWGQGELGNLHYWGGERNLQEELRAKGYEVYTVSVSPVGSNWDRAAELYAIIKGGRVDYGSVHSSVAGHAQFSGKAYPGIYPQWGERNPATGEVKKVHLVGHSMGGSTIRLLTALLENGDAHERAMGGSVSPLFAGRTDTKGIVESVTAISAPHNGNALVYRMGEVVPDFAAFFSYLFNYGSLDLMVDQWGLTQNPGESDVDYALRVLTASPLAASWDSSSVDLSPEGAAFLNARAPASPNVYYLSYATNATHPTSTGDEVPLPTMNPFLVNASKLLGSMTGTFISVPIDESWKANDGMLATSSQEGPTLGSSDVIMRSRGKNGYTRGVWNFVKTLRGVDHYDVVGLTGRPNSDSSKTLAFFLDLAKTLQSLPAR